jgi:hypothetical protein
MYTDLNASLCKPKHTKGRNNLMSRVCFAHELNSIRHINLEYFSRQAYN